MIIPRQGGAMLRLTRAQRRQMQKLSARVDRVTEADRLFLSAFPIDISGSDHKPGRDRPAGTNRRPPDDDPARPRWFIVHPHIAPGYRLCLFVLNLEGAETGLDETTAREIFEWAAEPYRDVEARLRKVAGARP